MSILSRGWLPSLIFVVSAVLFVVAGQIEAPGLQAGQLAPSFWPRAMLIGLMLGSLVKVVEMVSHRESAGPEVARPEVEDGGGMTQDLRMVGGAIGLVLGYVLLTDLIGFAFATFLFMVTFTYLGGWRRKLSLLLLGIVGTVAALYVFVRIVYLPLPKGQGVFEDLTIALYRLLRLF